MRPVRPAPPEYLRRVVTRPRLLAVLGERFDRRLIMVVAGAGFGKSTLLAQAVAENRLDPRGIDVWVECKPDHQVESELAAELLASLGCDATDATAPVPAICNAVWQRAPVDVALLLDDVHWLAPGSGGAVLLDRLLRDLPGNGHLVLAGRHDPAVAWSRLAAVGDATGITEADLAFAKEELEEFAELRGVASSLLHRVGGWPALAELTASTRQVRVADFLWEEILSSMPVSDRRLLAAVVAAGGADDEVAGALAGRPIDVAALMSGLPLVTLSDDGWYRLHSLWEPALARELTGDDVFDARRTAARVLQVRGDTVAAARLYGEAKAWEDVERLIVESLLCPFSPVGLDVLGEWLRRLREAGRDWPTRQLLEGALTWPSDPTAGLMLLQRAADGYRSVGDSAGEVACLGQLTLRAWWQRDTQAVESLLLDAQRLRDRVEGAAVDSLAALLAWMRVLAAEATGDDAAILVVERSTVVTQFTREWQAQLEFFFGVGHLLHGDPDSPLIRARRVTELGSASTQQVARSLLLLCLWLRGSHEELLQRLPELFRVPLVLPQHRIVAHAVAALVTAWAGRIPEAEAHAREADMGSRGVATPEAEKYVTAARLALALARDEEAETVRLAAALHAVCRAGSTTADRLLDRAFLTVQYVLLPSVRNEWDDERLHGCFAVARDVARVLVDCRAGRSVHFARSPNADLIRAFVPPAWRRELSTALGLSPESVEAVPAVDGEQHVRIDVQLLGRLHVRRDGRPTADPELRRQRVRELLAYLILNPSASRSAVAAAIWPDLDDAASHRNLRVTLTYLVRLLEPDRSPGSPPRRLVTVRNRLRLIEGPSLTCDVWTVQRLLGEAERADTQRAPSTALALYMEALTVASGPLLPDEPEREWMLVHQDELRGRLVRAAVRAGDLLLADGAIDKALPLAQRALADDPGSEAAHQLSISARLAAGDVPGARRALADCLCTLQRLDSPPDARTRMLARRLSAATTGTEVGGSNSAPAIPPRPLTQPLAVEADRRRWRRG